MRRMWMAAVLCLPSALPAAGARLGFKTVDASGKPVQAIVCVFATAPGSPLKPWLGSPDVHCFPSSSVVAFPNGDWTFYATEPGRYASLQSHRFIVNDDPRNTDTGFKQVQIDMAPAAKAILSGHSAPGPSHHVALYFPRTTETLPSVIPAIPAHGFFTVPVDIPFLPIEYAPGGRLIRVGNLHRATMAGETVLLSDFDGAPATDVVSHVTVNCRPKDLTGARASELAPPRFALIAAGGKRQAPIVPEGPVADGDLVIFKNVPAAAPGATIEAVGPAWEPASRSVTVAPNTVSVSLPVELVPAGVLSLTLSPNAADWLQELARKQCGEGGRQADVLLQLFRPGSESAVRTSPVGMTDLPALTFDRLPVGKYDVVISVAGYRSVFRKSVVLKTGHQTVVIDPDLHPVSGMVTRHNRAVRAGLQFNELMAVTNALGWYSVYLPSGAVYDRVTVTECDTGAQFVMFPRANTPFDNTLSFELPEPLTVRVLDEETSKPIRDAVVTISVSSPDDPQLLLYNEGQRTDAAGDASLVTTPLGKFGVCAKAEGYAEACRKAEGERETSLRLRRQETFTGTIAGVAPVKRAIVLFTTREGRTTEIVPVREDGTFAFTQVHGPNEFLIFVSVDYPLYVLPLPATMPLVVSLPPAPARTIEVIAQDAAAHEIGIAVGGIVVPAAALSRHQAARGSGTFTVEGRLTLAEIAETAPITVYKGFPPARPADVPPSVDAFSRPELLATFPRRVVPAHTSAVVLP